MGYYCRICGRSRPNERFSGRGHRIHVCRDCQKLPKAERRATEAVDEISNFLHEQSHISKKNIARLKELAASQDSDVAQKAAVMLEVARVAPSRRRRFRTIRSSQPQLWRALIRAGLIWWTDEEDSGAAPEHDEQWLELEEPMVSWHARRPMDSGDGTLGYEMLAHVVGLEIEVLSTETRPTSDDDLAVEIECRIDPLDVETHAFGILFALGVLSFQEARPAGVSVIDYEEEDQFTVADLLRLTRFCDGELQFEADYLRGRRMKTYATIRKDGRIFIRTTSRDLAPERWLFTLQGKRRLRLVPPLRP